VTGFKTEDHLFRTVDGIDLSGTLYRPDTNGPIPYVVEVHGGAWRGGDRLNNVDIHADLAKNGIGVFALDFRLSDVSFYPASVEDVNAGVRWFKANADRIDVEASSIGGLASSSGGQQLGMLALRPDDPAYQANDPSLDGVDASIAFSSPAGRSSIPWRAIGYPRSSTARASSKRIMPISRTRMPCASAIRISSSSAARQPICRRC
jgi:acetyl esterase/lipase